MSIETRIAFLITVCAAFFICNAHGILDSNGTKRAKRGLITPKPVCMEDLGCFSFDGPFSRIMQLAPSSRATIGTTFRLYTRKNPKEPQLLTFNDVHGLQNSYFNGSRETKIIIHGFLEYFLFDPKWIMEMVGQLLIYRDYNVIDVDWRGGNRPPYTRAISNARIVGAEVALLLQSIMNVTNASPSSFHIIGHSLGAHIAGYAGERIPNLGRITGLDPARPLFQNMPNQVVLDRSDAQFVDIIHTDIESELLLGVGTKDVVGHLDFYPNGGHSHPGCFSSSFNFVTESLATAFRTFFACRHQRSVDFFIASINLNQCTMAAYPCPSFSDFKEGACTKCGEDGRECPILGLDADAYKKYIIHNESQIFYLRTDKSSPFCKIYYSVEMKFAGPEKKNLGGKISLTLVGKHSSTTIKLSEGLFKGAKRLNGNRLSFLVDGSQSVGPVKKLLLKYTKSFWNTLNIFKKDKANFILLESVEVKQMHLSGPRSYSKFCYDHKSHRIDNKEMVFLENQCP